MLADVPLFPDQASTVAPSVDHVYYFIIGTTVAVIVCAFFVLIGPQAKFPLHFTDIHRSFLPRVGIRLPFALDTQRTGSLRHVAGFPNL